jgi:general secretion pathway protein B
MSFILDALKKSENERQRHGGPALFEVRVAARKPRLPWWALGLIVLLVLNVAVIGWLVLRDPPPERGVEAPPVSPPSAAPAAPSSVPEPPAPVAQSQIAPEPTPPAPAASPDDEAVLDPDDYEPAVDPASSAPAVRTPRVTRGTVEGLPTYDQEAQRAGSSLPPLSLDMHVYAQRPQDRFIFLNMQRLREGDSLPEGVRVESITPDGVVLSQRGSKFVLERQ